jgi:lipopolysaccharide cholinephosphotransferase
MENDLINVSSKEVRDIQLELLTILDEMHRICEKNKVPYFLIDTKNIAKGKFDALSTEINIGIMQKDWELFINSLKKEIKDEYYFHCFENDKNYNIFSSALKLRKRNTYSENTNFLLANRCKGNGLYVSVYLYEECKPKHSNLVINILKILIIYLENLRIKTYSLKEKTLKYLEKQKITNSDYIEPSLLSSLPKAIKKPLLKKEVFPLKKYSFEGKEYYSFNNLKMDYENKKGKQNIFLNKECSNKKAQIKGTVLCYGITLFFIFALTSILVFSSLSFLFIGLSFITLFGSLLYVMN